MNNWAINIYKSITTDKGEEIPWHSLVYIKYNSGDEITAMISKKREKELLLFMARDKKGILKSDYYKTNIEEIMEIRQIELEESYGKEEVCS